MPVSPDTIRIAYESLKEMGLLLPVIIASLTAVFGGKVVADFFAGESQEEK
jgi:hypothetical protein